ncbi:hypothetical protein B484DRAFT_441078, partial [Ochromonadaceae sp. CCMP2298]
MLKRHNQSEMGNAESKFDEYDALPDDSWTAGWMEVEEPGEQTVLVMEIANEAMVEQYVELLIGLRILSRDSCCDDLDKLLNIGGSTINTIFKQFVTGMATKLYDRHVHVPELDKIVETYT